MSTCKTKLKIHKMYLNRANTPIMVQILPRIKFKGSSSSKICKDNIIMITRVNRTQTKWRTLDRRIIISYLHPIWVNFCWKRAQVEVYTRLRIMNIVIRSILRALTQLMPLSKISATTRITPPLRIWVSTKMTTLEPMNKVAITNTRSLRIVLDLMPTRVLAKKEPLTQWTIYSKR